MSVDEDPFAVLGVGRHATLSEVRDARRRLARELHPDVQAGGSSDPAAMQRVNAAFDACVGHITSRRPLPPVEVSVTPSEHNTAATAAPTQRAGGTRLRNLEIDAPSFTIDALPAEAFEALLVALASIGEVIDDDPPYVLECLLSPPLHCWCRLELVPDAGGSTVSLAVASIDGCAHPPAEGVRD